MDKKTTGQQQVRYFLFILSLAVMICTTTVDAGVVINELMINEPGANVALEWVELFNAADSQVQLKDYFFVEGGDTTTFDTQLLLEPSAFVILARNAVAAAGESSFESIWGDNSGVWGDHPSENYLLIEAEMSLKNSGDSVKLVFSPEGLTEVVRWDDAPPDGVSLERINPYKPAGSDNFDDSRAETASTPGGHNSLLPPDNDLSFVDGGVTILLPELETDPVVVTGKIVNSGLKPSPESYLLIYFDRDFSGDRTIIDDLDSLSLPSLEPDSTYYFERSYLEEPGRKSLHLELALDGDSTNNFYSFSFPLGNFFTEFMISEFVINPTDDLDCEWVELTNITDYSLDIHWFSIGGIDRSFRIDRYYQSEPDDRVLLCEDSLNFVEFYGVPDCPLIQPEGWSNFTNSGDLIVLTNDLGRISDSIRFNGSFPNNVSWERDEDSLQGAFENLFYPSVDSSGSTPCAINSHRPLPPDSDLGFPADGLNIILPDNDSDPVELRIKIRNFGLFESESSTLSIYIDTDFDSVADETELLESRSVPALTAGDLLTIEFSLSFASGYYSLIMLLPDDDNPDNNLLSGLFSLGPLTGEIIVTEFLADPTDDLECEWLECHNVSARTINLSGWSAGDSLALRQIEGEIVIEPQEYFIITEDSICFDRFYFPFCKVIEPAGWETLNNSGDVIRLVDPLGTLSDRISYNETAGDNRSLELNEYTISGEQMWLSSSAESGSTPCEENSVSGPIVAGISVILFNHVFSPSLGETLNFRLEMPPATELTIEVFDLAGRRHSTIYDERVISSGEYSYDGSSQVCGFLPVGAYILKVTTAGDGSFSEKFGFAVAATH